VIPTRAMSCARRAALAALLCFAARPAAATVLDRIVATVDGDPITAHEVRRFGEDRRAHNVSDDELLDAVITDRILAKEIAARKISTKSEEIDKYVEEIVARNKMNDEQFKAALKQQGMTLEQYRARVKDELDKTTLLQQEMRGGVTVTPEQVKQYYDEHRDQFAEKTGVVVYDIFFAFQAGMTKQDALRVIEQAKMVKGRADAGEPFQELARKYSQGPGADRGGLLGTFKKGEMAPSLEQVAFALGPNEVSQPLVTSGGVHLIKADPVAGEGRASFEEVEETIRQVLYNQAVDQRFKAWMSKSLRERHHVEVLN
jgi:peptidyl-prolyl cis-trans isomerase SurA